MTQEEVLFLRNLLLATRSDIVERVQKLAAAWQDLEEPAIELEEEAQKASIATSYDKLDESGKMEIEQIDLALIKMSIGDYGICESCGDDIAPKRLRALPWARLCVDCARDYEKQRGRLPQTSEVSVAGKIPDEYQGMAGEQITTLIFERLQSEDKISTEELSIFFRKGVVFLDGSTETEFEHDLIMQILTDSMGFTSVVDRIVVNEASSGMDDASDGPPETDEVRTRHFYDEYREEAYEMKGRSPFKHLKDHTLK